jgi:hypothetical protein
LLSCSRTIAPRGRHEALLKHTMLYYLSTSSASCTNYIDYVIQHPPVYYPLNTYYDSVVDELIHNWVTEVSPLANLDSNLANPSYSPAPHLAKVS